MIKTELKAQSYKFRVAGFIEFSVDINIQINIEIGIKYHCCNEPHMAIRVLLDRLKPDIYYSLLN